MVWRAPARQPRDLSLFSHALGVAALAGLSFMLIEGPVLGWLSPGVLAAGVRWRSCRAGSCCAANASGSHPLLPRALFQSSSFGAANGVGFLINFCVFGQLFLLSLFLQQAGGADALQLGLALAADDGGLYGGELSGRRYRGASWHALAHVVRLAGGGRAWRCC